MNGNRNNIFSGQDEGKDEYNHAARPVNTYICVPFTGVSQFSLPLKISKITTTSFNLCSFFSSLAGTYI